MWNKEIKIEKLVGQTISSYEDGKIGDDSWTIYTKEGNTYTFYHEQDCCETVSIDDIVGDLSDLLDTPLLLAEEVSDTPDTDSQGNPPSEYESFTWTFYKFSTIKGSVTMKWYGTSNGYYSESVNLIKGRLDNAL